MKITSIDADNNTNVHLAATKGDMDALEQLDDKEKVDVENEYGWTPLMLAVTYKHVEAVKHLLGRHADATRRTHFGGSVFLMAVASGSVELVSLIMEHLLRGGVSKASMEKQISPLSIAILRHHEDVFKMLLEKGYSAKVVHRELGITPLMFAALNENKTYSIMLMSQGADRSITNNYKENSDDIYVKYGPGNNTPQNTCIPQNVVNTTPVIYVTSPQPPFFYDKQRKSSNVQSPYFVYTPLLSPVPCCQQVFFPANFNGQQYAQVTAMSLEVPHTTGMCFSPLNYHIDPNYAPSPNYIYPEYH